MTYHWDRNSGQPLDTSRLHDGDEVNAIVNAVRGLDSLVGYLHGHLALCVNGETTCCAWPITYPNGKPSADLVSITVGGAA